MALFHVPFPKIALCQMTVAKDKEQNLQEANFQICEAANKGADLVVLPEMFICPYANSSFITYAEPTGGPSFKRLSEMAKANKVWLIAGSVPEEEGGRFYNTTYVFNRGGELAACHRKVHLFDIDIPGAVYFKESETLSPGEAYTIFQTEFGAFGVAICYDMRFPELFLKMAEEGVVGVFVPAAFNMTTGPAHWHLMARMRAVDHQLFMMLCSPARQEDAGYVAYGHSLISDPWGILIGELDEKPGMLIADLNLDRLEEVRSRLPLKQHRRHDLYTVSFRKFDQEGD